MAGGPLCGQGSISSGHGDREGARVSLLAVRHFRGGKCCGKRSSLARGFAPSWDLIPISAHGEEEMPPINSTVADFLDVSLQGCSQIAGVGALVFIFSLYYR